MSVYDTIFLTIHFLLYYVVLYLVICLYMYVLVLFILEYCDTVTEVSDASKIFF